MGLLRNKVTFFAFGFAQLSYMGLADAAVDLLAQSKVLAVPARAYPELKQINDRVAGVITDMESNTHQLQEYRKARIRATDRRYSALTREFNRARGRLTELERKLEKAPSLNVDRLAVPTSGDRGSSSSDVRDRAIAAEHRKYEQAKASLKQSLKTLSAYYDQELREIANIR
jgi:DNA repair exonuclease SbcCD ATPase subunit